MLGPKYQGLYRSCWYLIVLEAQELPSGKCAAEKYLCQSM